MTYKVRRVSLDNSGELVDIAKRTTTIVWPIPLRIGGLYQLRSGKLYRVEAEI